MDSHTRQSLLKSVTDAVQAQERLQLDLKSRQDKPIYDKVYPDVCSVLDKLRDVKSEIDGSVVKFEHVTVNEKVLQELKRQLLMHVPGSMNDVAKNRLKELVVEAFHGSCKKVLYSTLVSCPWYRATQTDRGLQAKNNTVFVVYCNKDEQFFAPVNPHLKEKNSEIIDQGWFYATEVSHFASYLLKGKVRFLEALYMPQSAVVCSSDIWKSLKHHLEPINCLRLKGFLEQCRGQAVGSVARKSKSTGKMKLRDGATLYEFCESFRLLHHAMVSLSEGQLNLETVHQRVLSSGVQQEALDCLVGSYQADHCDKLRLLDVVMRWRAEVDELMRTCKYTSVQDVEASIGHWLLDVRTEGRKLPNAQSIDENSRTYVQSLLDACVGGPVSAMVPDNIILIARAGSYLYGLDTPESDIDYIIVYADPIQKILSSCHRLNESAENRGPEKNLEYGAYEARLFCEMLWKCSVVMLELIFADNLEYSSPLWKDLVHERHTFLTERAILQYFGLIKNNMTIIENRQFIGSRRESKLFYQILHKLYCLEFFLRGECPQIKCAGHIKEHILRIRKGPLEGDITRDNLYEECRSKMWSLRQRLGQRSVRLPENVSYDYLIKWLLKVRGWNRT